MIQIEALKELAKKLSFYQSSISEDERISLILFALKEFLTWQGLKIEEPLNVKSANEYFDSVNKAQIDDLSWLKHGENDLEVLGICPVITSPVLEKVINAYRIYFTEIKNCGDVTHSDFTALDKNIWIIKALFFYITGQQPYNFTKSKPSLVTIKKYLKENISDFSPEEIQGIQDTIKQLEQLEKEAV